MIKNILIDIIIWFSIGVFLLNIIVYFVYKTDIVYTARNKDGTLKKRQTTKGIISMSGMLLLITIFLVSFDYMTFNDFNDINFIKIFVTNFFLILLLILYDSFFIDLFVLGKWKPKILNIPEEVTSESMKNHVKKQFTVGWIIVIPIVLIGSLIFYSIFI